MSQIEYFKIPKGFSRWLDGLDWSETCDAVVVTGGPTLALGTALAQFIEGAFRNTQPIHFAYVLHFLASIKYEDDQWRRLHDLGFAVNRNSGVLFTALTRQVPRLDLDFDMAETRRLLLQHTELVSVHWLETSSADIAVDAASFDLGVAQAVQSLSADDIKHWLRHGRGPLPETGKIPDVPKREQTFTELVEKLLKSPRLAGVSDLMQQVIAAVSIPPRSQQRTELPIGGYSSIVNRGQPDQILMSEHAVDELEFLRRYANNELLYWQREEPQNQQAEELCIVLDQGVRTWGEPRLALTAAALALGKQAEKAELPCKFVFSSGADFQSTHADKMSAPHFESSDLTSNPAQALREALADTRSAKDIILLTHPRILAEPELIQAASEQTEVQRLFAITVDEKGIGTLQQLTTAGQVKLRTFELNIQPPITERPEPELEPKADKQWTGDIDPIPMPFKLGLLSSVACISITLDLKSLLVIGSKGDLSIWSIESGTCELLPRLIFDGSTFDPRDVAPSKGKVTFHGVRHSIEVDTARRELYRSDSNLDWPTEYVPLDGVIECAGIKLFAAKGKSQWGSLNSKKNPKCIWLDNNTGTLHFRNEDNHYLTCSPERDGKMFLKLKANIGESDRPEITAAIDGDILTLARYAEQPSQIRIYLFCSKTLRLLHSRFISRNDSHCAVVVGGYLAAIKTGARSVDVIDTRNANALKMTARTGKTHSSLTAELGQNWLTLYGGKFTHLLRWDRGPLEISFMQGQKDIGDFVQKRRDASVLNPHGSTATQNKLTETYRQRWHKQCFKGKLTLLSDNIGNVAVLGDEDKLIVMFHVYRGTIAAWMPDGTRYGPASLAGGPTTKGALDKIGAALSEASI